MSEVFRQRSTKTAISVCLCLFFITLQTDLIRCVQLYLPNFNPAGCDYIGSGLEYSYAIYSTISLTYTEANERCAINHKGGRLAWMANHDDFKRLEYVLLYLGYISLNIEYWIDGVLPVNGKSACDSHQCRWTVQRSKAQDATMTYLPGGAELQFSTTPGLMNAWDLYAPVLQLIAHINQTRLIDTKTRRKNEPHGFICSYPKENNDYCPFGFYQSQKND